MNSYPPRNGPLVPEVDSRRPVGNHSNGPLEWPLEMISSDWRKFQPKLLCSAEGIHMIVSPCDSSWWAKRELEGTSLSGFQFKTAIGEFVIEGRSSKETSRSTSSRSPSKATSIVNNATGEVIARSKDRSSLIFSDGASFTMIGRRPIPLFVQSRNEFFDKSGKLQFRVDKKKRIWLTDQTDRNHVLFLIAADRFFHEVDEAEAI